LNHLYKWAERLATDLREITKIILRCKNHDGQQFHQNEQSPLTINELTDHKKDHSIWRWKYRSWLVTCLKMRRY